MRYVPAEGPAGRRPVHWHPAAAPHRDPAAAQSPAAPLAALERLQLLPVVMGEWQADMACIKPAEETQLVSSIPAALRSKFTSGHEACAWHVECTCRRRRVSASKAGGAAPVMWLPAPTAAATASRCSILSIHSGGHSGLHEVQSTVAMYIKVDAVQWNESCGAYSQASLVKM